MMQSRILRGLAGGVAAVLCVAFLIWARKAFDAEALQAWSTTIPAVPFFLAQALMPLVGFPSTPFFIVAGVSFGATTAVVGSLAGVTLNLALSYWIAASGLRPVLVRLLARTRYSVPVLAPRHEVRLAFAVRLFPAMPNFVKNYLLCLAGVPFGVYIAVSMVTSSLYALSFVFLGESLFEQDFRMLLLALTALLLMGLLAHLLNRRLAAERENAPAHQEGPETPDRTGGARSSNAKL